MDQLKTLTIPNTDKIEATIPGFDVSTIATIKITGGSFTPSTMNFSNISQSTGGTFAVTAVISGKLQFSDWYEKDKVITGTLSETEFHSSGFVITFQSITLSITIVIALDDKNELQLKVKKSIVTGKSFTFDLPSQTALTGSLYGCVTDKIKDTIRSKISSMTDNIAGSLQSGINEAVAIIPDSGKLTDHITFHFPGTQNGLQFPSDNNGAQYRVLGQVTFDSQNAPGDIGTVPFPPIPTDRDGTFSANNYEFNALFWAFYQEGDLHTSFNKATATFKPGFNTSYYSGTPLAEAYPDRNLIIDLVLTQAPTVNLTEGVADISYQADLTYWIAKEGSETEKDVEAFKMSVTDLDGLDNFAVSSNSKMLQLITFKVTLIKDLSYKLISTNIPGLDAETFEPVWKFMLHPTYIEILNKAAQVGVPLPSSLQGIFTDYKIDLHVGYASASVNFTSAKRYRYLLKKRHDIDLEQIQGTLANFCSM